MYKIYGIEYQNKIIYVGQTIQKGKKRWYDHIRQALNSERTDKLHLFLKEKGIENFKWVILEEIEENKELLNQKEEEYIMLYDTHNNGFNVYKKSSTVNLNPIGKKVLWFDNNRQYVKTFNSIVLAEFETGVNCVNISHCCNHCQTKTSKGWFRFEGDLTPLEDSYRLGTNLKVDKLDPFTREVLYTYNSLQQAEQSEGIASGYLSAVCSGKRYGAKNFLYQYNDESKRISYFGNRKVKSGVAQVNKDTKIVLNKFLTCQDASDTLGFNIDTISRARHNGLKPVVGYIWVDAFDYLELLEKGIIFENDDTRRNY